MPFALSAGQPRGWASSCRAHARGGRRLAASIAVDRRAALPSGGRVAAGCHLSSSNVPGWVVSQPWWLESRVVAFRRKFESPRAYRPAPRKRGACAADERRRTHDAAPAAPTTASPGAHCCAYAPGNAPPAADFSECAPCGAHTAKSNRLGRLPTLRVWLRHAVATARPLRIARDYGGFAPSPRPSPSGEGSEGSRPLRRGTGRRGRRPGHTSEARPCPKEPPKHTRRAPRPKAPEIPP